MCFRLFELYHIMLSSTKRMHRIKSTKTVVHMCSHLVIKADSHKLCLVIAMAVTPCIILISAKKNTPEFIEACLL